MFDFPANPAIGDVSNGYRFNGTGWAGGPIVSTPAEQFLNVSGLGQTDITVPSWAKGVTIEGIIFPSAAGAFGLVQVSMDGTTFLGGSLYNIMGPYHNYPSPYYGTQGNFTAPGFYLAYPHDNLNVPQQFRFDLNLEVVGTNNLISAHMQAQNYGNSAGLLAFQMEWFGYINATLSPGRAQKLRIVSTGGTFSAGSWVKIRWLGDAPPQTNAIGEAPMDGEYVRFNGVWRLKSQSFAPTTTQNIPVPAGARMLKLRAVFQMSATGANAMRWSVDGTTFLAGASDYTYGGKLFYTGTVGSATLALTAAASIGLTQTTDTPVIPIECDLTMNLTKAAVGTQDFGGMLRSAAYHSSTGALMTEYSLAFYGNTTTFTSATAIKAVQIIPSSGWLPNTVIDTEWVY